MKKIMSKAWYIMLWSSNWIGSSEGVLMIKIQKYDVWSFMMDGFYRGRTDDQNVKKKGLIIVLTWLSWGRANDQNA